MISDETLDIKIRTFVQKFFLKNWKVSIDKEHRFLQFYLLGIPFLFLHWKIVPYGLKMKSTTKSVSLVQSKHFTYGFYSTFYKWHWTNSTVILPFLVIYFPSYTLGKIQISYSSSENVEHIHSINYLVVRQYMTQMLYFGYKFILVMLNWVVYCDMIGHEHSIL